VFSAQNTFNIQSEHKELYTLKKIQEMNAVYLEIHTHTSQQKNYQSSALNDLDECCCCAPLLDVTSFLNGYPTTEELLCSAVGEERVCNSCASHPWWSSG
jgi:hypothetical protein